MSAKKKKNKLDMSAVAVSPFSLSTPRGRRRISLLIILSGLAASYLHHSNVLSDIKLPDQTDIPVQIPWTPTR